MNSRIEALRAFIWNRKHHGFRRTPESLGLDKLNETFKAEGVPPVERSARMLKALHVSFLTIMMPRPRCVSAAGGTSRPQATSLTAYAANAN